MASNRQTRSACPILALPREIRDEIYSHLIDLGPHLIEGKESIPQPSNSARISDEERARYIDRSVELPLRFSNPLLNTCHQIRNEYGQYLSSAIQRSKPVLIFMESVRQVTTNYGLVTPTKDLLTPAFQGLAGDLKQYKRALFRVWPGWQWWSSRYNDAIQGQLDKIMPYMTSLEEVHIELYMDPWEFTNHDLDHDGLIGQLQPFLGSTLRNHEGKVFSSTLWEVNVRRDAGITNRDNVHKQFGPVTLYKRQETLDEGTNKIKVAESIGKIEPVQRWFDRVLQGEDAAIPMRTFDTVKSTDL